jgi:hypothetical protein
MAQVALPVVTIERLVRRRVSRSLLVMPPNLLIGDGAIRITLANHAEDGVPV